MKLKWTYHSRDRLLKRFKLHPYQVDESSLVLHSSPRRMKRTWRDPVAVYFCKKHRFYLRINTETWEVKTVYVYF